MIKILFRSFLIFIIFIGLILTFLLTPMGLKVSVEFGSQFLPGKLTYKKLSGIIIGPITVSQLQYQDKDFTIAVKKLRLNWNPSDLFEKKVSVSDLKIENATITTTFSNVPIKWTPKNIIAKIHEWTATLKEQFYPIHFSVKKATINQLLFTDLTNNKNFGIHHISLESLFSHNQWNMRFFGSIDKPYPISFHFLIDGKPNQYQLGLTIEANHTDWAIEGTGNENSFSIHTTKSLFLNGDLQGKLQFDANQPDHLTWNTILIGKDIHLSLLDPSWIKSFSINLNSSGEEGHQLVTNTEANIIVDTSTLHAILNYKNTWNIQWDLHLKNLENFIKNTKGELDSVGQLNGDLNNPTIDATLNTHLQSELTKLTEAKIILKGNLIKHNLAATVGFPEEIINVSMDGSYSKKQWNGQVNQFTVLMPHDNTWRLLNTFPVTATKEEVNVPNFCLHDNHAGNVCINGTWSHQKLLGHINLNFTHFQWLKSLIPDANITHGDLVAQLDISGNAKKPTLGGMLHLQNASIHIPKANVTLNHIDAHLSGLGKTLEFKLTAFSKNQPINATGSIDLSQPDFPIQMKITSNNALIFNTDEYVMYASSDLNLLLQGHHLSLTGEMTLPQGKIDPNDKQTTTSLPSDVVIIGLKDKKEQNPWTFTTHIVLHLGNKVFLNISNLKADVKGTLNLLSEPGQSLTASGQVFLSHGQLSTFGGVLKLSKHSYLTYSHSEINNPNLNLSASKVILASDNLGISNFSRDKLIVGVNILGNVQSPQISFYSNRANLSQSDILSYLLLGYSNSGTPGNTDFLLRALSAVNMTSQGLLGKQNIASQIEKGLGLSELGVESETTVDALGNPLSQQSSFVVGKHLSKRFYLRYSIGLKNSVTHFNPGNVLELRYLLHRHWALQVDSSQADQSETDFGGDVLYTISK